MTALPDSTNPMEQSMHLLMAVGFRAWRVEDYPRAAPAAL